MVITPVPRLIGSLQGCQDEKAAWEDIYRQGRQTFFIVVIAWNKGFIYIGEEMVLTALRSSLRSKVQRSSAVLELPPFRGTPSLLVRTSNWSLSTRTCKERLVKHEMCIELCCILCVSNFASRQTASVQRLQSS